MITDEKLITVLNGSLGADRGNTAGLIRETARKLETLGHRVIVRHLRDERDTTDLRETLERSAGFVFATGTYWDSWGSPLQSFLEQTTDLEAGAVWLGKSAAVLVTMHSVGGKEVLSRLQGVLCTLGLQLPPMSGLAYSLAAHAALSGISNLDGVRADLWSLEDLDTLTWNLSQCVQGTCDFKSWPVDGGDPHRLWLKLP